MRCHSRSDALLAVLLRIFSIFSLSLLINSVLLMLVSVRIVPRGSSKINSSKEDRQDTKHECQRGKVSLSPRKTGEVRAGSAPPSFLASLPRLQVGLVRLASPASHFAIHQSQTREGGIGIGTEGEREREYAQRRGGRREKREGGPASHVTPNLEF